MLCNIDCDVNYFITVKEPPNLKYAFDGFSFIKIYIMELGIALLSNYCIVINFKLMMFKKNHSVTKNIYYW